MDALSDRAATYTLNPRGKAAQSLVKKDVRGGLPEDQSQPVLWV